jgi:uridylate kinase
MLILYEQRLVMLVLVLGWRVVASSDHVTSFFFSGAGMAAAVLQVWKDVDGVLTSDPRIVTGTRPVTELTYEEATELAFFGAQVGMEADSCIWLQDRLLILVLSKKTAAVRALPGDIRPACCTASTELELVVSSRIFISVTVW